MAALSSSPFFPIDKQALLKNLDTSLLKAALAQMFLIRHFEMRAEVAYQQGKIGDFFHSYIGQEAIQVAAVSAFGKNNWYATSYRCHALALLLGATPEELMAELFGKSTGNAKGRGGSMHFFTERLLGGFGIVTGQVPIATGAAFTLKYKGIENEVAVCFLGDGAVPQGAFHESLNLASLWKLPCIYIIENNKWGMGTAVERAVAATHIAEEMAPSYKMKGYTLDGTDFFHCYGGFAHYSCRSLKNKEPVLVELKVERFKGHSISDLGLYRTKENLKLITQKDPILLMQRTLLEEGIMTEEEIKESDHQAKESVLKALTFAEQSPWPDPHTLEEEVFAP